MANRITIKVYFTDGDTLITDINCTLEQAENYYRGTRFTYWDSINNCEAYRTAYKVEQINPTK